MPPTSTIAREPKTFNNSMGFERVFGGIKRDFFHVCQKRGFLERTQSTGVQNKLSFRCDGTYEDKLTR